ncbi:MAG: hypothetical protein HY291_16030 [Planctomycetes bacterium]|nr:hypothetical protein [Planctomycetota bacterium]
MEPTSFRRFSLAVWLGIAGNVALAVPLLFVPAWGLGLFSLPLPDTFVWTRLAGLLVILLSLMYVPVAVLPEKLGRLCWLVVIARAGAAAFFLTQGGAYLPFAAYDALFGVAQAALLAAKK